MDDIARFLSREQNRDEVLRLFGQHLALSGTALLIASALALPLGVLVARWRRGGEAVLGVLGVLYTIPSLALLVALIPIMGLGFQPAVTALVVYAQLVLVRNVAVGLRGVDPAISEAARGMGLSGWQRLLWVELPLALPVIVAGLRIATLSTIAIATVAALINAGGLGTLLFRGVQQSDYGRIYIGAFAIGLLAIICDQLLRLLERRARRIAQGGLG
jgi:osmoprotectant transport system permease protein